MAVNGQYDSPPFGLQGAYASTGADGSQGDTGLVDNMSPPVSDAYGQGPVGSPGQHGAAQSAQVHDGFTSAVYTSTGAGMGHAQMNHPDAEG
jgi:hypothetical protein